MKELVANECGYEYYFIIKLCDFLCIFFRVQISAFYILDTLATVTVNFMQAS